MALPRRLAPLALAAAVVSLAAAAPPVARGAEARPAPDVGVAAGGARWMGPPAPARPRRVVSLAPSLTDLAVAMGMADRLVGVTRYDHAPEVAALPRVGGFLDPSPEAVLALRPDLVLWLTDGGALPAVERIAALGIPVRALPIIGVPDVLAGARLVGAALGDAPAGERLAHALEEAIARARRQAGAGPRVRTLFVVGRDPLVVAGPGSYPDELLRIAGGDNVVAGTRPWPIYPLERAVADDPALVIDAAVLEPAEGLRRLAAIPAVRDGRVARLADDAALRPGPQLARALEELGRALRGAAGGAR